MAGDKSTKIPFFRSELTLETMQKRCKGSLAELIGLEMVKISPGKLASRIVLRPNLLAPNGFLHAATIIALADTTCGWGTLVHLPEGAENFTTVELKTNFLGTLREGMSGSSPVSMCWRIFPSA